MNDVLSVVDVFLNKFLLEESNISFLDLSVYNWFVNNNFFLLDNWGFMDDVVSSWDWSLNNSLSLELDFLFNNLTLVHMFVNNNVFVMKDWLVMVELLGVVNISLSHVSLFLDHFLFNDFLFDWDNNLFDSVLDILSSFNGSFFNNSGLAFSNTGEHCWSSIRYSS